MLECADWGGLNNSQGSIFAVMEKPSSILDEAFPVWLLWGHPYSLRQPPPHALKVSQ